MPTRRYKLLKETDALKKWGPLIKFVLGILTLAAKAAASAVSEAQSYIFVSSNILKSSGGWLVVLTFLFDPFPAFLDSYAVHAAVGSWAWEHGSRTAPVVQL